MAAPSTRTKRLAPRTPSAPGSAPPLGAVHARARQRDSQRLFVASMCEGRRTAACDSNGVCPGCADGSGTVAPMKRRANACCSQALSAATSFIVV